MKLKSPNFLLITSDQQHWTTLGVLNQQIKTPNLDRLATMGTLYERAYCPNPTCTPTRASIITGMYPSQHGAWSLGTKLDEEIPTLGEYLMQAGYATHLIGKAHFQPLASTPDQTSIECQPVLRDLEFWKNFKGPWYGFETVELTRNHTDESHVGQHYALWLEEKGLLDWREYFNSVPGYGDGGGKAPKAPYNTRLEPGSTDRTWALPEHLHYSVWTAERTIANIRNAVSEGRPFFTWASFHDPHPPYTVPEPFASMYDPADMPIGHYVEGEFDRMTPWHRESRRKPEEADFSGCWDTRYHVHGAMSHLHDEQQLRADMASYYGMVTLMDREIGRILDELDEKGLTENTVIVFTSDHGHFLGQHGLIAKAIFNYEDVIRVPFIAKVPNQVQSGDRSVALQSLVDLAPTFMRAAGLGVPGAMTGVDQSAVWRRDQGKARNSVLVEHRFGKSIPHLRTYVDARYKLTLWKDQVYGELFDLQTDPDELNNLWDDPAAQSLKGEILLKYAYAEMDREPMRYPRIAGA
ncbi:MAG: sulfatase-like hydrolase/transferase [Verrucomicrobia bacterium]|nr:sulfatase-like hydrolase/transferase [Verrucomicrobiota bacterium]